MEAECDMETTAATPWGYCEDLVTFLVLGIGRGWIIRRQSTVVDMDFYEDLSAVKWEILGCLIENPTSNWLYHYCPQHLVSHSTRSPEVA